MSFNEYGKEKAAKRRKTWLARDKRYIISWNTSVEKYFKSWMKGN